MRTTKSWRFVLGPFVAASISAGAGGILALAPAAAQQPAEVSETQLLEDFAYYVNIANWELAKANAVALLDRNIEAQRFAGLVEESPRNQERFERASRAGQAIPDLAESAARLDKLYQQGKLARARDPQEIQKNIDLLVTTRRGQLLGTERLKFAGEYAVPQLLGVLQSRKNLELVAEAERVLVDMGPHAVAPLSTAIVGVDATLQETLARVLGRIPYRWSLPALYEVRAESASPAARAAAERAITNIEGGVDESRSIGSLYRELAQAYGREPVSLTLFPGEDFQLLWSYQPEVGLQPVAVRTEVFHEARAMSQAERALRFDATDDAATATWIAANLRRAIEQPADYDNPAYPAGTRRDAMYYAVAAGSRHLQTVLAGALEDRDTRLARSAMSALSRSAGGAGLWRGTTGESPLVAAMSYPDRRVQIEAALILARANPASAFAGSERVVTVLASALRDAETRTAIIISRDVERQQELRSAVEAAGYRALPPASSLDELSIEIAEAASIDLLITAQSADSVVETIEQARRAPRLSAAPVLALLSAEGLARATARFSGDRTVKLVREGVNDEQIARAAGDLVDRIAGPAVPAEQTESYSSMALAALQTIAVAGRVYDVRDATATLIEVLPESEDLDRKLQVAEVLAHVPEARAQVALVDAAINAEGGERLVMLSKSLDSAKRFGNLLEPRHETWITTHSSEGDDAEATAVAALMGALNLKNAQVVPLILGK